MEVKLHKGPKHGKTIAVREGQREIVLSVLDSAGMLSDWRDPSPLPTATISSRNVVYRMKIMSHPDFGTFPCVDPDGRVFFEYVS